MQNYIFTRTTNDYLPGWPSSSRYHAAAVADAEKPSEIEIL